MGEVKVSALTMLLINRGHPEVTDKTVDHAFMWLFSHDWLDRFGLSDVLNGKLFLTFANGRPISYDIKKA